MKLADSTTGSIPTPFRRTERAVAKPFLKWAGGKTQLLPQLLPLLPARFRRYHEPFVGSGALFFRVNAERTLDDVFLSDSNAALIELYQIVRDHVDDLVTSLAQHRNEADYFYQTRGLDPAGLTPVERASRFIYLNKTCYNGLFRLNRSGRFNVPFGRYRNPDIVNDAGLRTASRALQDVQLSAGSFETCLERALPGDFLYFDPPYHPVSTTARFTAYTGLSFGERDQQQLRDVFAELDRRGCLVMLSNSDTELIRSLYRDYTIRTVTAKRAINSVPDRRGPVNEVIVTNYLP